MTHLVGNHKIELHELVTTKLVSGASRETLTKQLDAWANRDDTGGTIERDEKERAVWTNRFTIRAPVGNTQPQIGWRVKDATGNYYIIEDIAFVDRRGIHIHIDCTRDTTR